MRTESNAPALLRFARTVDRLNGWIGNTIAWLVLVMAVVAAGNAVARYSGRFLGLGISSNALLEAQWYLFSILFLLGGAYVLREDAHVRVDVFYSRLQPRGRTIVNIAGTLLLLIPFCLFLLWVSWPVVRSSWLVHEGSPDPGGLPRYPLKAMVIVCFVLLLLQAVAELIKEVHRLRHGAGDPAAHPPEGV